MKFKRLVISIVAVTLPSAAVAQTGAGDPEDMPEPQKICSPYVERTAADANLAEGVYWGDTHLHTSYSTDSGMFGNPLGPEESEPPIKPGTKDPSSEEEPR